MTRLTHITRDELDADQIELWDSITVSRGGSLQLIGDDGALIGPFNAFVHEPALGTWLSGLGAHLRFSTSIERRLSEVAICTVGAHWRSEFEFWAHGPMAIAHGVDVAVIDAIREGRTPQFGRDDERIVHAVASQLLTTRRVDDATFAEASELLGEIGLVELSALVGYYCLISTVLNLFEVAVPDAKPPVFG